LLRWVYDIIAPIPGKGTIGIEVPNVNKEIVKYALAAGIGEVSKTQPQTRRICLGKSISNEVIVARSLLRCRTYSWQVLRVRASQ
jgi:DNA segregation ATPase FtsK/SpoIIIE-like protein